MSERATRPEGAVVVHDVLWDRVSWQAWDIPVSDCDGRRLYELTMERCRKGQLEGPWEIHEVPFEKWSSGRRFLKEEPDKLRDIDDTSINATVEISEKIFMSDWLVSTSYGVVA